jgi:hypothetical protein
MLKVIVICSVPKKVSIGFILIYRVYVLEKSLPIEPVHVYCLSGLTAIVIELLVVRSKAFAVTGSEKLMEIILFDDILTM